MKVTKKRKVKLKYFTIGARFLTGTGATIYTYKVRGGAKVYLGQELVVDTPSGPAVVAVVRIDTTPQDTQPGITYKFVTRKTVTL